MQEQTLFQRRKENSIYWFNKSSDLIGSAAALWCCRSSDLSTRVADEAELGSGFSLSVATPPVYEMLCGMAMELVLKSIVVEIGGTVYESSHDLLLHLSRTNLNYSPDDRELLKILSQATVWAGRYPTPKKEIHMDEYHANRSKSLYDSEKLSSDPNSTLKIQRPNGALRWENFLRIWSKASDHYWAIRAKKEPA